MASPLNFEQIMFLAAERADMLTYDAVGDLVLDDFILESSMLYFVNEELAALWDHLIASYEDYHVKRENLKIIANTDNYSLPKDFYKSRKLFPIVNGKREKALKKFNMRDLGYDEAYAYLTTYRVDDLSYRILGNRVWFMPIPSSNGDVELWYVPQYDPIENLQDKIHFSFPTGWEDYVIEGIAARLLEKEESDPSGCLRRQQMVLARILQTMEDRDIGEPHRMIDEMESDLYYD